MGVARRQLHTKPQGHKGSHEKADWRPMKGTEAATEANNRQTEGTGAASKVTWRTQQQIKGSALSLAVC